MTAEAAAQTDYGVATCPEHRPNRWDRWGDSRQSRSMQAIQGCESSAPLDWVSRGRWWRGADCPNRGCSETWQGNRSDGTYGCQARSGSFEKDAYRDWGSREPVDKGAQGDWGSREPVDKDAQRHWMRRLRESSRPREELSNTDWRERNQNASSEVSWKTLTNSTHHRAGPTGAPHKCHQEDMGWSGTVWQKQHVKNVDGKDFQVDGEEKVHKTWAAWKKTEWPSSSSARHHWREVGGYSSDWWDKNDGDSENCPSNIGSGCSKRGQMQRSRSAEDSTSFYGSGWWARDGSKAETSAAGSASSRKQTSVPSRTSWRDPVPTGYGSYEADNDRREADPKEKDPWPDASNQFLEKYALGDRVAAGLKGVIHIATDKQSGQQVAVKKPKDSWDTSDYDLLAEKRHPNIVRAIECFSCSWETHIVMEWCAGGDLFNTLQQLGKPPTERWSAKVFEQIIFGMKYLHQDFGESHNDIKPENLLLDRKPVDLDDVPRMMLADFGCTATAGSVTQKNGGGDPRYRAPETFGGAPFGFATDLWATGVVLHEILSHGLLIYTRQRNLHGFREFRKHRHGDACHDYMRALTSGRPVDVSGLCGPDAENLLAALLDIDPKKRASVQSAITHPWLTAIDTSCNTACKVVEEECPGILEPPPSPTKKNARGGC